MPVISPSPQKTDRLSGRPDGRPALGNSSCLNAANNPQAQSPAARSGVMRGGVKVNARDRALAGVNVQE